MCDLFPTFLRTGTIFVKQIKWNMNVKLAKNNCLNVCLKFIKIHWLYYHNEMFKAQAGPTILSLPWDLFKKSYRSLLCMSSNFYYLVFFCFVFLLHNFLVLPFFFPMQIFKQFFFMQPELLIRSKLHFSIRVLNAICYSLPFYVSHLLSPIIKTHLRRTLLIFITHSI